MLFLLFMLLRVLPLLMLPLLLLVLLPPFCSGASVRCAVLIFALSKASITFHVAPWSCGGFTHRYEDWRGKPLSPPTEIDALYGLLFASFYYLYLQARAFVCIPFPIARGRTRAVDSCVCSVGAGW
jgi:hypothetical protein